MKQIQVSVPSADSSELVKSLNEVVSPSQIEHIKGNENSLIIITTHPHRTGFVLDHLYDQGIGRVKGRITVSDITATLPKTRPRKQDKFLRRISLEEMEQTVSSLSKLDFNYIVWTVLSSILAGMGLINNDNVTLIASMIVAPMMGPIVAIAFGAMTSNQKVLKQGFFAELSGMGVSIFIGFIIGLIYGFTQNEPSAFIISRGQPSIINLIIAIASGLAAGLCFVSGTSLALVGVAAAAALLPVTVNLGITLGMFEWLLALGSLVLFVTNVACVHLGCMFIFLIRKVEPPQAVKKVKAKRSSTTQIVTWAFILLIVAIPITQTSVQVVRQWKYERIASESSMTILEDIDGYIATEELDVIITGSLFRFEVNIELTILSTTALNTSVFEDLKEAIEIASGHQINLRLTVMIGQQFDNIEESLEPMQTVQVPFELEKICFKKNVLDDLSKAFA